MFSLSIRPSLHIRKLSAKIPYFIPNTNKLYDVFDKIKVRKKNGALKGFGQNTWLEFYMTV